MTYRCDKCGGVFEAPEGDDEAAMTEKTRDFPDVPMSECKRVCEDCYQEIMASHRLKPSDA